MFFIAPSLLRGLALTAEMEIRRLLALTRSASVEPLVLFATLGIALHRRALDATLTAHICRRTDNCTDSERLSVDKWSDRSDGLLSLGAILPILFIGSLADRAHWRRSLMFEPIGAIVGAFVLLTTSLLQSSSPPIAITSASLAAALGGGIGGLLAVALASIGQGADDELVARLSVVQAASLFGDMLADLFPLEFFAPWGAAMAVLLLAVARLAYVALYMSVPPEGGDDNTASFGGDTFGAVVTRQRDECGRLRLVLLVGVGVAVALAEGEFLLCRKYKKSP